MKLHLMAAAGRNLFTGYGPDYVTVNHVRHERHLIVMPDRIIDDWQIGGFEDFSTATFEFLLSLEPEIVILGTGRTLRFPPPSLVKCLSTARVGLEVMDTGAACRTYNILTAEGRKVVAALLIA